MKTIQIPTTSNPFIVSINNHVYTYRAGSTVEVPDEVAAAIEDALELEPKPKRNLSMYDRYIEGSITEVTEEDLENVGFISEYTLYKYDALKTVTIPKGITSIGNSAFRYCSHLTKVDISEDVATIGGKAMADSPSLERVIVRRLIPPTIQSDTFVNTSSSCTFEVPFDALEAYKSAQYWSAFANQIIAIKE